MKKISVLLLIIATVLFAGMALSSCNKATEGLEFYPYGDEGYSVGIENGKALKKIVIPKEHDGKPVVAIAKKGFLGCENAQSVYIPDSVKIIGENAFQNCYKLEKLTLPGSVTEIGSNAFKGCKALTSLNLPEGTVSVGEFAFSNCKGITNISFSSTVTTIGACAFEGCTSLTSVSIPKNVTAIGDGAFQNCSSLTVISVDENSESYKTDDNILYSKDGCTLIQHPAGKSVFEFIVPDTVTRVGAHAFAGCNGLIRITIPKTATSVGEKAFDKCPIENATVPTCALSELPKNTIKLLEINGGEKIEKEAFKDCDTLKRLTIAGSVKEIGDSAFYGCNDLRNVIISEEGLEVIDEYAFKGCPYLEKIDLPESLKTIGSSAFKDCIRIAKIIIPEGVTKIDRFAFEGCLSLRIYCRGTMGSGWNDWWNSSDCPVTWRYVGK